MTKQVAFALSADIEAFSAGEEKRPSFRGVAYSGGAVPRRLWDGSAVLVDIDTFEQLPEGGKTVFVLSQHDPERKIGTAKAFIRSGKIWIDEGVYFDNEYGTEARMLMEQGAPYQLSIGFTGDAVFIEDKKKRKKRVVNGEEHEIGCEIKNGRLNEVSFVVTGADPKTWVEKFSAAHPSFTQLEEIVMSHETVAAQGDKQEASADTVSAQDAVTIEQLKARVQDLLGQLTAQQLALKAVKDELEAERVAHKKLSAEFSALRNRARDQRLDALWGDDVTAQVREQFYALPDEAFDAIMTQAEKNKPATVRKNGELFVAHEFAQSSDKAPVSVLMQSAQNQKLVKVA